jgi:hypothetical protein
LQSEKKEVYDLRINMRRDADKNKAEIIQTLDVMKTKGKIDTVKLSKFGINVDRFNRTE